MSDPDSQVLPGVALHGAPPMDTVPADNSIGQTPLHYAGLAEVAAHGAKERGVVFQEQAHLGLMTLRASAQDKMQLEAFEQVMGMALPIRPLATAVTADRVVRWQSPDEWLISVPRERLHDLECRFREVLPGHYALVNVSGGLAVWKLSGEKVTDLLKKCVPIDVHLAEFPAGKVVSTVFAKGSAILRREGVDAFELVVRRSYCDYLWRWIQDASQEYGLVVKT